MKKLFIIVLLIAGVHPHQVFAQTPSSSKKTADPLKIYNAYTLAKEISNFWNSTIQDSANRVQANRVQASRLISYLIAYADLDTFSNELDERLKNYSSLNTKYQLLKNEYFSITPEITNAIFTEGLEPAKKNAKNNQDDLDKIAVLEKLRKSIEENNALIQKIVPDSTVFEKIIVEISKLNGTKTKEEWKSTFNDAEEKRIFDNVLNRFNASSISVEEISKEVKLVFDNLKLQINGLKSSPIRLQALDVYLSLSPTTKLIITKNSLRANGQQYLEIAATRQLDREVSEISTSIIVNAPQNSSGTLSLYSSPESATIDAVAILVTKRFQQEAMLWFFDEMRKNSELYSLFKIAFPESMKLLQSEEIYKAPNLSSSWKYAMCKDFVTMPKHVLTSDWLRQRVPEKYKSVLDYMPVGWDIARYIEEKYNYRDVIRQLYLTKRDIGNPGEITPNTFIDMLYGFSNELTTTDLTVRDTLGNFGVRFLTYEELRALTAEEMEIIISLIDLKYHNCIQTIYGAELWSGGKFSRDKATEFSVWLGKTTATLRQFDNVLRELSLASKEPNFEYNFYNVWILMSEVMNQLLPASVEENPKYQEVKYCLDKLSDTYEIYDLLSKKSYSGAVAKTIDLIDELIYSGPINYRYSDAEKPIIFRDGDFDLVASNKVSFKTLDLIDYFFDGTINQNQIKGLISAVGKDVEIGVKYINGELYVSGKDFTSLAGFSEEFRKLLLNPDLANQDVKLLSELLPTYAPGIKINLVTLASKLSEFDIKSRKINKIIEALDPKSLEITIPMTAIYDSWKNSDDQLEVIIKLDVLQTQIGQLVTKGKKEFESALKSIEKEWDEVNQIPEIEEDIRANIAKWQGAKQTINKTIIATFPPNSAAASALASWDRKSLQMMRRLSSFLNDAALASNPEELADVISSYALPPGSYKQKRSVWRSVDINAFVGPYFAHEWAPNKNQVVGNDKNNGQEGFLFGISAPIGISWTHSFSTQLTGYSKVTPLQQNNPDLIKIRKGHMRTISKWSLTTTFSIVDIGAVVSYRTSNTDSILPQYFKWEQFLSPGLHFGLSIPGTPLVASLGVQYTPQIRRLEVATGEPVGSQLNMVRLYAGIYFDLPLFNLYSRQRFVKAR